VSGVCGWYDPLVASEEANGVLQRMTASLRIGPGEAQRTMHSGPAAIGCSGRGAAVDVAEASESQRLCAVIGRPHWADTALADEAARSSFARSFLAAYDAHGVDAFAKIRGAFALALIDGAHGEVLLATDRMGIYPIAYAARGDGLIVFGSTNDAIASHPRVPIDVDGQALFDYVYFHMIPGPRSALRSITRLGAGSYGRFRGRAAEVRPYWEMRYFENENPPFALLKDRFIQSLRATVTDAASDEVGAFLSGGTDSSTIAGLLAAQSRGRAKTFSIGFDAAGYDEMSYARIAARHFDTQQFEYYVTPDDVVAAVPALAEAYDQPFGNASAVPTYYCARLAAAEGVTRLLGGDGGDELFGGNARYATQHLLSLYTDLPHWLRAKVIEPLAFRMPGSDAVPGMRKVRGYISLASKSMPARLENYNLVERLGIERIFGEEFLSSVDVHRPLRELAETYRRGHARSLINLMLALDLKYTLADNDLPKVTRMCDLAGVECCFPMLDERVVDFSAHLAPRLKLKGTRLRYFFKRALGDLLPREIIAKSKHGFGLPFGVWLEKHRPLRELALDSLADLRRRRIVRPEFVDDLTGALLKDHASYYGVMIWVLMMLENWFKHHVDTRRGSLRESRVRP
jgi:asparagine synthase (glutamine-hydrolysing)